MSGSKSANEKQFPGQHDGEVVQLVFRQHPLVMRKVLVIGLLVKIMLGVVVLVLAGWFYRWMGWYYSLCLVTDRRILVIKQKGFFNLTVDEWQLDGISNVNYHIGAASLNRLERYFGVITPPLAKRLAFLV